MSRARRTLPAVLVAQILQELADGSGAQRKVFDPACSPSRTLAKDANASAGRELRLQRAHVFGFALIERGHRRAPRRGARKVSD